MKIPTKRLTAALAALMMCISCTACGDKQTDDIQTDTSEVITSAAKTESSETAATASDFFDNEDYDPLSDDYDPYGGGGAATVAETSFRLDTENKTEEGSKAVSVSETENKQSDKTETVAETSKSSDKAVSKSQSEGTDAQLTISVPNGWSDGTADYSQIDGTVKNKGKSVVDGWTAVISLGSGAFVEQSWNCDIAVKDGTFTITPVEHNRSIDPGGEGTFGFIVKNPGKIDTDNAKLTFGTSEYTAVSGNNNSGNSGGTSKPSADPTAKKVPEPTTDDWLSVKGNKIVDSSGNEVWLTGVNWFGYNTGTNTFDGLWTCDLNSSLSEIANRGFNLLRVPISTELINSWAAGEYPTANFNHATNDYLVGMNSLEIFDYVIGQCRANGIKIMIDIHCAKTDAMGHMKNMWYDGDVTEKDYLDALSWIAERYKNDDTIIAYDLENEPHGKANEDPRAKWDSGKDSDNWKYIAEKAAMAVLNENPHALVMVEGIEIYPKDIKKNGDFSSTNPSDYYSTWWGGNLRGVKNDPIDLGKYNSQLVYSPHDYGPAVYQQEWFKGDYTFDSLKKDAWQDNWLYIYDTNTAPLLIGEWGGYMSQPNLKWMTYLRQLIKEKRINHTFWCFNANSGDTGGLVKDDFTTWDEEKYEFVKEVLWQEDGKFVGLDHKIPLGENGKCLGE